MTGDTYLPFWQNETCGGLFSERPPQVVKLQQHSAPGPYMGIPGKGVRNHTAGIQTPQAINKAKCRVIVVAAFLFFADTHQWAPAHVSENKGRRSWAAGVRWRWVRTDGGAVKSRRPGQDQGVPPTGQLPSRPCEGDASHSNRTAIFSLHTTLRFKVKATDAGPPGCF